MICNTVELEKFDADQTGCGDQSCQQPHCLEASWLAPGRLGVRVTTWIPISQSVDPGSGDYYVAGKHLRLHYGLISRDVKVHVPPDWPAGMAPPPPPACLVPLTLHYEISRLSQADYEIELAYPAPYPFRFADILLDLPRRGAYVLAWLLAEATDTEPSRLTYYRHLMLLFLAGCLGAGIYAMRRLWRSVGRRCRAPPDGLPAVSTLQAPMQ